jgi:hypothetical protein
MGGKTHQPEYQLQIWKSKIKGFPEKKGYAGK